MSERKPEILVTPRVGTVASEEKVLAVVVGYTLWHVRRAVSSGEVVEIGKTEYDDWASVNAVVERMHD